MTHSLLNCLQSSSLDRTMTQVNMTQTGFQNNSVILQMPADRLGWFQKIEETLNTGDPVVREWFLVRQPLLPILLCVFYAIFSTRLGPALMKNRRPFDLRKVMVVFNFSVVIAYVASLYLALTFIPKAGWEMFCRGGKVVYGEASYTCAYVAWVVYILKYIEFFDTVFFVLRKKQDQITFLHVVHHTSVPFMAWIMMRMETSGMQSIPAIINGFVHVIMYTYYGLAAMGPEMRKHLWWKKYLTQIQMIQFVFIIAFVTLVVPMTNCSMKISSYVADILLATVFLHLFYQYYQRAFKAKKV